jgi:hypothetical protein
MSLKRRNAKPHIHHNSLILWFCILHLAAACFTAAATKQKQAMRFLQSWEGFQGKGV